ncbi:MAG: hypothetical protein WDN28_05495 [Chthoniobacter sp.]
MDNVRSTFPLDEAAIKRQALRQILTDPITWVPLVPVVAAYTIFGVPALLALVLWALVLGGIAAYWRRNWASLTDPLRRQAVTANNRAQDAILQAAVDELRAAREGSLAQKLAQFLGVKGQVEARLHEDGHLSPQKIQLEHLVDSLCFGVRDQLQALLARESKGVPIDRPAVLRQVDEAFQTLQAAVAELDAILGPTAAPEGAASTSLEEITRRLREETDIARRVQARLRAQETAELAPEPPHLESP